MSQEPLSSDLLTSGTPFAVTDLRLWTVNEYVPFLRKKNRNMKNEYPAGRAEWSP